MSRLLILACSQSKNPIATPIPAIDRYDGPTFRVLRKYLREEPEDIPTVLILSAKFGLIAADREIPDYDCRLTRAAAMKLRMQVRDTLRQVLGTRAWRGVGLCAGKHYRIALEGMRALLPKGVQLSLIEGGQGTRLTALKKWLVEAI